MSFDARATAWLASWRRVGIVTRWREKDATLKSHQRATEVPWQMAQLLEEARILAELTRADQGIGFHIGEMLEREAREKVDRTEHIVEMVEKFKAKGES